MVVVQTVGVVLILLGLLAAGERLLDLGPHGHGDRGVVFEPLLEPADLILGRLSIGIDLRLGRLLLDLPELRLSFLDLLLEKLDLGINGRCGRHILELGEPLLGILDLTPQLGGVSIEVNRRNACHTVGEVIDILLRVLEDVDDSLHVLIGAVGQLLDHPRALGTHLQQLIEELLRGTALSQLLEVVHPLALSLDLLLHVIDPLAECGLGVLRFLSEVEEAVRAVNQTLTSLFELLLRGLSLGGQASEPLACLIGRRLDLAHRQSHECRIIGR